MWSVQTVNPPVHSFLASPVGYSDTFTVLASNLKGTSPVCIHADCLDAAVSVTQSVT